MMLVSLAAFLIVGCEQNASTGLDEQAGNIAFENVATEHSEQATLLAHGERIATVLGCNGCHGQDLQGRMWEDDPEFAVIWASNLTKLGEDYDAASIEQAIRFGRAFGGREMYFMPSDIFTQLSDEDMAAIIAFIQSAEPEGEIYPDPIIGPGARAMLEAQGVADAATMAERYADQSTPEIPGRDFELARYIARSTCAECHKLDTQGIEGFSPPLFVAAAYSRDEFTTLLREGKGLDDRDLGLMGQVAQSRYSRLTQNEINALYEYFKALAET